MISAVAIVVAVVVCVGVAIVFAVVVCVGVAIVFVFAVVAVVAVVAIVFAVVAVVAIVVACVVDPVIFFSMVSRFTFCCCSNHMPSLSNTLMVLM